MDLLEFFIGIILPAALWSGAWLSLQQKWVRGIFPGWGGGVQGKFSGCIRLTILTPSYADCLEIWEPQTPRTISACNKSVRIALSFHYIVNCYTWSRSLHGHFGEYIRNTLNIWNLELEKDGENHLDQLYEKCRSVSKSPEERNILLSIKWKTNWWSNLA